VDTHQHGHDLKPGTATTRSSTPLSPLEPASLSTYTRSTWYTYPYKILGRSPVDLLSLCCAEAQSYPIPRFLISRSPATTRNPLATMERDVHLPRSHPHAPDELMGRLTSTRRRGHEALQRERECINKSRQNLLKIHACPKGHRGRRGQRALPLIAVYIHSFMIHFH